MKPQNVMLVNKSNRDNGADIIKIIDFGLAKRLTRMRNSQVTIYITTLISFHGVFAL